MDRLDEIEARFGVHSIFQLSLRAEGPTGLRAIVDAVQSLRDHPPTTLGGLEVSALFDLAHGYEGLGATDGVLLQLGESGRVVVRPSGTEPKLKAYIEITAPPSRATSLSRATSPRRDTRRRGTRRSRVATASLIAAPRSRA